MRIRGGCDGQRHVGDGGRVWIELKPRVLGGRVSE
jgi:hypothetical protein